jgi:hypothetical protein
MVLGSLDIQSHLQVHWSRSNQVATSLETDVFFNIQRNVSEKRRGRGREREMTRGRREEGQRGVRVILL